MTSDASAPPAVRPYLERAVRSALDAETAWTLADADAGYRLELPDRTLRIRARDGPDGAVHWTLSLRADGATVGKFGPFEDPDTLAERVATLLCGEVRYTVCCDG